ncbi:MAG: glycosyltransferase family 2 protein [Rhodocyclaceae bacterium]|nr:glycosyltransferase family 2 protein [Rhodocyclaceae bacterium]MBP6110449.1 glycosyltransferase family 2 protein [Rhodocyclaceae bacterium]MBP6280191.1 glycosyltransferase family 2 protein [Rhodocyclaceae bacterium]
MASLVEPVARRISAVIITKNAANELAACLASVAFCDEILVVDSGSEDATVELATSLDARVIQTHWRGFGPQKQFAVEQAMHDWVLCVDADERVSAQLASEVTKSGEVGVSQSTALRLRSGSAVLSRDSASAPTDDTAAAQTTAYRFARCNRFMGRYLRHGEGYPDWSLRLFDRRAARWSADIVHEKVIVNRGETGTLAGDLLHESAESLDNYLAKQNRYSTLAAQIALAQGKRANIAHLLISPAVRFIKFYFFRLGFLDGAAGLVHILIGCIASFAKYAKMLAAQK